MGYTIAIRTLGTSQKTGEYRKLLDSIAALTIQPEKIVVVLPEGYALPYERLGCEEFVFSKKGMVPQRLEALRYTDSEYIFFCDDDLEFPADFIKKLIEPLENRLYDCATGPLFELLPQGKLAVVAGTLMASNAVSFNRDKYVRILRSGGWSYHRFNTKVKRYYPTESFAGACFLIRTETMRQLRLEDEIWMERYGYSSFEDRIMVYKLIKSGLTACIVSNAEFIHNDAKSSTKDMDHTKPIFCGTFNHTVFWKRFVYDMEKTKALKLADRIAFSYWVFMNRLYYLAKSIRDSRYRNYYRAFCHGLQEAKAFIKSEEYRKLPPVFKK